MSHILCGRQFKEIQMSECLLALSADHRDAPWCHGVIYLFIRPGLKGKKQSPERRSACYVVRTYVPGIIIYLVHTYVVIISF